MRFLYVGEYDVQWDNLHGLGLAYMHARHYSPALGRFLQPDPDGSEANLYAYAANNPVTEIDPDGTCFIVCAIVGAVVDTAIYLATTDSSEWSVQGVVTSAATGAVIGATGVGLLTRGARLGALAVKAVTKVPKAGRLARAPYAERVVSKAARTVSARGPAHVRGLLSPAQRAAAARNSRLERAFLGYRYHQAVAREASALSRGRVVYRYRGPDFVDRASRVRVELTTRADLARHVRQYGPQNPTLRYVTYR